MTRRLCLVGLTLCLALVVTIPARAHEIGTTRVTATVEHGSYRIEIVTDAAALAEKLAAVEGWPTPATSDAKELEASLQRAEPAIRRRVSLRFDDVVSIPAFAVNVVPATDAMATPVATIQLTGQQPSNARTLGWTYGWTFTTYAFTLRTTGSTGDPSTTWLEGGSSAATMALGAAEVPARRDVAWRYFALGFTHILPHGLDHMLFVLGIFLLTRRAKAILWQVSAFTLAHSITLGLSIYGLVSISPGVVEPLIALSIAYVAIENVLVSELKPWRIAFVFAFGLLHGLGFAGALRDVGLPRSEFATALVTFNVGVEAGQLAVIAAAMSVVGWYARREWYRRRVVVPASVIIACVAVYWVADRLMH
jgi:hypothetical protein